MLAHLVTRLAAYGAASCHTKLRRSPSFSIEVTVFPNPPQVRRSEAEAGKEMPRTDQQLDARLKSSKH